jgi:non-ribosomal peptide synthetase component F
LTHIGACSESETIVQMAECSFDDHLGDILGTVMIGATLIMLHPRGLLDLEYLTQVLEKKQITCMTSVPSLFDSLFHFMEDCNKQKALKYMKSISSGGMYFTGKILDS